MGRRRRFVEAEAIRERAALNDWQIEEIKKGTTEAKREDFASDEDMKRTMTKWTRSAG
jgi:predicted transcriptional regulator